jgi:integrative and conjugative element protein (TIGR02256 family)
MKFWRCAEGDRCLLIQGSVIDVFSEYAQVSSRAPESGGILLGYVRTPYLEVLEASEPTSWDRRMRFFFDRGTRGHRELAERKWRESNGLVRFIGEWHTHPQDHPAPSYVDRTGWVELAKNRQDQRPVLAVIVGRKALHVELINCDGTSIVMQPAPE